MWRRIGLQCEFTGTGEFLQRRPVSQIVLFAGITQILRNLTAILADIRVRSSGVITLNDECVGRLLTLPK